MEGTGMPIPATLYVFYFKLEIKTDSGDLLEISDLNRILAETLAGDATTSTVDK